jgi:monofunctional biosynthetic peptidoglycan transglycosylase
MSTSATTSFLRLLWKTVTSVLLAYAVVFSVGMTALLIIAAVKVIEPIRQVKRLADHNPAETIYMKKARKRADDGDTLLHTFVELDSISPHLVKAVLAAEDDGFYTHPGIDLNAILRALEYNRRHNDIKHGASTISQQMAKNLFAGPRRTFARKYRELIYTLLMERYLGKDRILELYLNYAQWGEDIFGCEAAARHYYGTSSRHLSLSQACRLAAVLASPERLNPHYTKSTFLQKRLGVIANNLGLHHYIDDSTRAALTGTDTVTTDTVTTDTAMGDTAMGDTATTSGNATAVKQDTAVVVQTPPAATDTAGTGHSRE